MGTVHTKQVDRRLTGNLVPDKERAAEAARKACRELELQRKAGDQAVGEKATFRQEEDPLGKLDGRRSALKQEIRDLKEKREKLITQLREVLDSVQQSLGTRARKEAVSVGVQVGARESDEIDSYYERYLYSSLREKEAIYAKSLRRVLGLPSGGYRDQAYPETEVRRRFQALPWEIKKRCPEFNAWWGIVKQLRHLDDPKRAQAAERKNEQKKRRYKELKAQIGSNKEQGASEKYTKEGLGKKLAEEPKKRSKPTKEEELPPVPKKPRIQERLVSPERTPSPEPRSPEEETAPGSEESTTPEKFHPSEKDSDGDAGSYVEGPPTPQFSPAQDEEEEETDEYPKLEFDQDYESA